MISLQLNCIWQLMCVWYMGLRKEEEREGWKLVYVGKDRYSGVSKGLEDEVEEEKELEDDERKDVQEEGVDGAGEEGGRYGLIGGELVSR